MYPSIKYNTMKRNIFILFIGLFGYHIAVFGESHDTDTITRQVEIQSDTTIIVRDLFGADCKLYGDKIVLEKDQSIELSSDDGKHKRTEKYTVYGGEGNGFKNRIIELNADNSKYVINNGTDGICIKLSYSDLITNAPLNIRFYGAIHYNTSDGWCRNKKQIYSVTIVKKEGGKIIEPVEEPIAVPVDKETDAILDDIYNRIKDIEKSNNLNQDFEYCIYTIFAIFAIIIIIMFICINKQNKKIKKLTNRTEKQTNTIDINNETIRQIVNSSINSKDLANRISNEDVYNVINRSEIQLYVQTIIAGKVDEYLRNKTCVHTQQNYGKTIASPRIEQTEFRITNIKYDAKNNCFSISDDSDTRIFEVYSKNGEYYYTIVNDPSIRKELLSVISAFSGCLETTQDTSIPSTVEVIKDGHLNKSGDTYYVDTSSILQISLR